MSEMPTANDQLKAAVRNTPMPAYLETRIRALVRSTPPGQPWGIRMVLAGALAAGAVLGMVFAYQQGHFRFTGESQESYVATVGNWVSPLMRAGLGNHIHCSVYRKYPANPPKIGELIADIGPRYAGLIPIVRKHVPERFQMTMAHRCGYREREFVHLSFKDGAGLLSVLITRKNSGESFDAAGLLPSLVHSGIPIYQSGVQRFAMTSFETRDYLAYLVSDSPSKENTELMLAMDTEVRDFLKQLET